MVGNWETTPNHRTPTAPNHRLGSTNSCPPIWLEGSRARAKLAAYCIQIPVTSMTPWKMGSLPKGVMNPLLKGQGKSRYVVQAKSVGLGAPVGRPPFNHRTKARAREQLGLVGFTLPSRKTSSLAKQGDVGKLEPT